MKRGFTIASVGYWGTNLRTLNAPDEFELGKRDVLAAIEFYRAQIGEEPPLVTISLGNHLALAALGKDRLERMDVLSLVPVMDGLQHHIGRFLKTVEADKAEAEAKGEFFGEWISFNVHRQTEDGPAFDYSRSLAMHEVVPRYVGEANHAWKGVEFQSPCSAIVLGAKDPRTLAYLEETTERPAFVQVWDTDHITSLEAPERTRTLFADFADCLVAQKGELPTASNPM